ncbi:hypothetical protein A9Q84_06270 [Halobacteriovorax marinus]|uniref:Uncharacterized protein n=1 Tax=Halobacteriovorax marinus TaxID=97084 RepID=A0A1Y5FEZ2_9BACT|nr:hypothetical protein A9Q84_06270 [Halobacteriovorax marinus]
MNSLIEMATHGHYPILENEWINTIIAKGKRLSESDKKKAQKILKRVSEHRSLERQKTVIFSMSEKERSLFIKAFMNLVEGRILDEKPHLH